ncbi:MAG: group 1 truncated hemoglobin [Myxococcota bacterium]|nr:group 1 truncated hemoglobin [Myxococcota bacterium]
MTDFERLGGEPVLRVIVTEFVDRVFADSIIGFFFQGKNRERIIEKELEHAIAHLGGPQAYSGRPIQGVHQPLRINAGQFRRRLAILRKVLSEQGADEEASRRWLEHDAALLDQIATGGDCID